MEVNGQSEGEIIATTKWKKNPYHGGIEVSLINIAAGHRIRTGIKRGCYPSDSAL